MTTTTMSDPLNIEPCECEEPHMVKSNGRWACMFCRRVSTAEVRELARRWSTARAISSSIRITDEQQLLRLLALARLQQWEGDQLFAWTRAKLRAIESEKKYAAGQREHHSVSRIVLCLWPSESYRKGGTAYKAALALIEAVYADACFRHVSGR